MQSENRYGAFNFPMYVTSYTFFLFRTATSSIQGINSFLIHSTRENESNTTFETSEKGAIFQENEILNLLAFKTSMVQRKS